MRAFPLFGLACATALLIVGVSGHAQDTSGGVTTVAIPPEGKAVFEQICQACHMADARGGGQTGAKIPALAGNPKLADKDYIVTMLLKGRGGMPWFTEMLTQSQMAAVSTYVRSHFNAYPDVVTEADVKRVAAAVGAPPKPDCNTCN